MASKAKKDHMFTEEEKTFLRNNISNFTYRELTNVFNNTFNTNLTQNSISDICLKRLGIKRDKPYVFFKGKKDFTSHNIGTEVFDGEYIWVKISDNYHEGRSCGKYYNENWVKKHVLTWEQKYGAVTKGNIIVFLDLNRRNCEIDNLYSISRKINFMMAKNGWYTTDRQATLTAIKWCELFYALKGDVCKE